MVPHPQVGTSVWRCRAIRADSSGMTDTTSTVHLVGRLGNRMEIRELPSGDEILTFNLVVDRPKGHPGTVRVDTIPCQTLKPVVKRRLESLEAGEVIEAEGRLVRRFWRSGTGLASAMEVEVETLRRLR